MSELNLPDAPVGHFWRVSQTLGLERVQLRKRVWFFSVKVDDVIPIGEGSPEENVLFGAELILKRLANKQKHEDFMNKHGDDHE